MGGRVLFRGGNLFVVTQYTISWLRKERERKKKNQKERKREKRKFGGTNTSKNFPKYPGYSMMELLNSMFRVNERDEGVHALYRVYRDVEKNMDPDSIDVAKALGMMEDYYNRMIDYYENRAEPFEVKRSKRIINPYKKRLSEIRDAVKSGNAGEMLVALDSAVGQWHMDFPVIAHLGIERYNDDEANKILSVVRQVLHKLGRLPLIRNK